jgi:DNA-binding Lrp family transcriptional regulator
MPKQKMIDLLYELMKNSKRSDRELAKVVKVSQPTITRMRKTLEKKEYIREYTIMPAVEKLGFELTALTFLSTSTRPRDLKEMEKWISESQKIIFSSLGEGLNGKTLLLVSVHRDFTDFSEFAREVRGILGLNGASMESFLVSLRTDMIKRFSFKNLERI